MQTKAPRTGTAMRENGHKTMTASLLKTTMTALACCAFASFAPGGDAIGLGITAAKAQGIISVGRNNGQTERVTLGLNKSLVLDLPADAHDILVANPEVADAVSRSARRIYLFGKKVGETNIFVFDKQGRQLVSLDLQVERDVAGLDRYLERFIPGSSIKSEIINDNIVLTGRVQTPQDASKAAKLAEIFVKGGDATENRRGFFFGGTGDSQIVNMIEIVGGDQVTLKVTVAEVQRSVMKQLGVNLSAGRTGSHGITFDAASAGAFAVNGPISGNSVGIGGTIGGLNLEATLQAAEQAGVSRTLAAPMLTAVSGEEADFRVGGEFQVPAGVTVVNGVAQSSFREVEYGIALKFKPVVLSAGRISLNIETEVSEPTVAGGGTSTSTEAIGGAIISLRRREAKSTVELPSGGSMVIAGLIQDEYRQTLSGFPGLSKVPVLGTLFRSRDFVRNESELVIIVTPYLVRPVAASALAQPTDNLNPPSDGAATVLGRLNRIYGSVNKDLPAGRYHGAVGFIYK